MYKAIEQHVHLLILSSLIWSPCYLGTIVLSYFILPVIHYKSCACLHRLVNVLQFWVPPERQSEQARPLTQEQYNLMKKCSISITRNPIWQLIINIWKSQYADARLLFNAQRLPSSASGGAWESIDWNGSYEWHNPWRYLLILCNNNSFVGHQLQLRYHQITRPTAQPGNRVDRYLNWWIIMWDDRMTWHSNSPARMEIKLKLPIPKINFISFPPHENTRWIGHGQPRPTPYYTSLYRPPTG